MVADKADTVTVSMSIHIITVTGVTECVQSYLT